MVLVTLVPMFAPKIMGIAVFTGTLAATNPTMMEVEVEEDWKHQRLKSPQKLVLISATFQKKTLREAPSDNDAF